MTYSLTSGTARLACGLPVCQVIATGDGRASMNVVATSSDSSVVTASLSNGSKLDAHFTGGTPPTLRSLTSPFSLAAGTTFSWTGPALALVNGTTAVGQTIIWQAAGSGIAVQGSASAVTDANGIATKALSAGPLSEGQSATITACVNGTTQCVTFSAFGARPQYAMLQAVSGTPQHLAPTPRRHRPRSRSVCSI